MANDQYSNCPTDSSQISYSDLSYPVSQNESSTPSFQNGVTLYSTSGFSSDCSQPPDNHGTQVLIGTEIPLPGQIPHLMSNTNCFDPNVSYTNDMPSSVYCDNGIPENGKSYSMVSIIQNHIPLNTNMHPNPVCTFSNPTDSDNNNNNARDTNSQRYQTMYKASHVEGPKKVDEKKSKLEAKRERNRVAARKCRDKKINRIEELKKTNGKLRKDCQDIKNEIAKMEDHANKLRTEIQRITSARSTAKSETPSGSGQC